MKNSAMTAPTPRIALVEDMLAAGVRSRRLADDAQNVIFRRAVHLLTDLKPKGYPAAVFVPHISTASAYAQFIAQRVSTAMFGDESLVRCSCHGDRGRACECLTNHAHPRLFILVIAIVPPEDARALTVLLARNRRCPHECEHEIGGGLKMHVHHVHTVH